jgi:hypothetical protein
LARSDSQHPPVATAVVLVTCSPSGNVVPLCAHCLNLWLDNADDEPDLEPAHIRWLNASATLVAA